VISAKQQEGVHETKVFFFYRKNRSVRKGIFELQGGARIQALSLLLLEYLSCSNSQQLLSMNPRIHTIHFYFS